MFVTVETKQIDMKKLSTLILALALLVANFSCGEGNSTTIRINDGRSETKIKYSGLIAFDSVQNRIANMEPRAYFEYSKDGKELVARSDKNGMISYVIDGEKAKTELNNTERQFLAGAIREITKAKTRR